jgi:hypothetical protein
MGNPVAWWLMRAVSSLRASSGWGAGLGEVGREAQAWGGRECEDFVTDGHVTHDGRWMFLVQVECLEEFRYEEWFILRYENEHPCLLRLALVPAITTSTICTAGSGARGGRRAGRPRVGKRALTMESFVA